MNQQEKHFVYFYYDKNDTLLYIGKAIDVGARWNGHNDPWKHEVVKIGVISCPDQAAMDVLENYFIAKVPTKYNRAGLQHGYTSFEIPNLPQPTIYTIAEFKTKYLKNGVSPQRNYPPMENRIRAEGLEIIDVGSQVDVMEYLDKDLDRICFRYKNLYLISRHSPVPNYRRRLKKDDVLHRRTNEKILNIKAYYEIPNKKISVVKTTYGYDRVISFETDEAGKTAVRQMFDIDWLYDFFEVSLYRPNHEIINLVDLPTYDRVHEMAVRPNASGFDVVIKENATYGTNPTFSFDGRRFVYDFEKVLQEKSRREQEFRN